uniref:C-type lectin domain-containing protein n=1 Tax=Takifugu rubripes TaxID=31033 RepID=H2RMX2_TAKRU
MCLLNHIRRGYRSEHFGGLHHLDHETSLGQTAATARCLRRFLPHQHLSTTIRRNLPHHIWVSFICLAEKSCRIGWTLFNNFCYFFSCELKSWEASRQNCRQVGADLVVVDTSEEQKFLSKNIKKETWIGLNDVETEGTWKWTDGNPLTKGYLSVPGWSNWNDISCNKSLQWVCEKKLG